MTVKSPAVQSGAAAPSAVPAARWGQLLYGILCMVMIANMQYGWTLFVNPIDQKYHWGTGCNSGRIQRVHRHRDLARAGRRLVR